MQRRTLTRTTTGSSTRTRPRTTSRTSRRTTTPTRSSTTTSAKQEGNINGENGGNLADEISWMAMSNNNRGTARLGPPTTTTTSIPPPPPPPMLQEEGMPMPPPLHPDMLLSMGYPEGTTRVLEEGVWQPIFPGEAEGAQATATHRDPLQQYHSGWSIFADEGSGEATGSASSQGGPQQHSPGNNLGVGGHHHSHQQPQQQPYLPRQAVNRGAAPAAASQWHSGWSPAHQHQAHYPQPQYTQQATQGRGTWGYAATAGPSKRTLEAQIRPSL